jgi:RNA polymerase sigma-70 factor (ECF subfamily)
MDRSRRRSAVVTTTVTVPAPRRAAGTQPDVEALYRSARDDVFAYVATLLRDRGAAEDVTAMAFERAYRKRRSFDARRGSERAWLFGIARNAALDELRRRKRTAALGGEPPDSGAPSHEDEAEGAVRRAALRSALATLQPRERELIALKFHAGLDNGELASVLGVTPTNAGTQLHRAMTKLRRAFDATA